MSWYCSPFRKIKRPGVKEVNTIFLILFLERDEVSRQHILLFYHNLTSNTIIKKYPTPCINL